MTRQAPGHKAWGNLWVADATKPLLNSKQNIPTYAFLAEPMGGHMIRMVLGLMTVYGGPDTAQQRAFPAHQAQKQIPNNQLRIIT
jgi:hypothetical protein